MNAVTEQRKVLLEIADLKVHFDIKDGKQWFWQPSKTLKAVDGVTLRLYEGETLGVVGESGCGKSTFARAIIGLVKATDGKVAWLGKDLLGMKQEEWRDVRSDIQMIFQDPLASLNPRMTIGEIIAEPLRTYHPKMPRQEVRDRVKAMMMKVGLLPNLINRYPHEFSGGQCQRIGIARALIAELTAKARENKLAFVTLEVRESNAPAIALYTGAGFAPVGKRNNFYSNPTENAVLMTISLI